MTRRSDWTSERGVAAIELVLVTPLIIVMVVIVAGLGRMAGARGHVDAAAREAARAASLERIPERARPAAVAAARAALTDAGVSCSASTVTVDLADYRPGGRVSATVTCTASLADLGLVFPATKSFTATAVVPIEQYRSG